MHESSMRCYMLPLPMRTSCQHEIGPRTIIPHVLLHLGEMETSRQNEKDLKAASSMFCIELAPEMGTAYFNRKDINA